jgi:hypothetical protein
LAKLDKGRSNQEMVTEACGENTANREEVISNPSQLEPIYTNYSATTPAWNSYQSSIDAGFGKLQESPIGGDYFTSSTLNWNDTLTIYGHFYDQESSMRWPTSSGTSMTNQSKTPQKQVLVFETKIDSEIVVENTDSWTQSPSLMSYMNTSVAASEKISLDDSTTAEHYPHDHLPEVSLGQPIASPQIITVSPEGDATSPRTSSDSEYYSTTVSLDDAQSGIYELSLNELDEGNYLAHGHNIVLDTLPVVFREVTTINGRFEALKPAILSLAAGNLARMRPELKPRRDRAMSVLYGPCREHQLQSQNYYNRSINRLIQLSDIECKENALMFVATLLVLGNVESAVGNFRGFVFHLSGIEKLVTLEFERIKSHRLGHSILAAWISSRAYNWWLRLPITTAPFQRGLDATGFSGPIQDILITRERRCELAMRILCESHRLNYLSLLERIVGRDDSESAGTKCYRTVCDYLGDSVIHRPWRSTKEIPDDYRHLLELQSRQLDDWHARLELEDLPIESFFSVRQPTQVSEQRVVLEPLRFQSHTTAMNYAYYSCARVLQSEDILDELTTCTLNNTDIHPWILLCLRIAAGLDLVTSIRRNMYTIGIISILLVCVMRSANRAVTAWVTEFVAKIRQMFIFGEGNTPVVQTLEILQMIETERNRGRDVYAVFLVDSGEDGKSNSYNSQDITSAVVYGRIRVTGELFHDQVDVVTLTSK